ncbi:hypothetical protein H6CHR_00274 [Variovorax sp. PBL-H6]|uniref:hypothetical protein n=1 Tax=Variovorax sp. PBL-H6 TaxID=434009 RepID=UPI0013175318|nr:hypothetical protein [Variovorax sp. PBL-H6]VTU15569.1 hypothetical protein H6CHR_00274 [Variovorax sp. PBL-H6]
MSASRPNNTGRPLPTPGSTSKATAEIKNVSMPQNTGNLAVLVPKESPHSSPERPRPPLNQQDSEKAPESQASPPKRQPPPVPRRAVVPESGNAALEQLPPTGSNTGFEAIDLPSEIRPAGLVGASSSAEVKRRLTTSPSGKAPAFLRLDRLKTSEQKNSSPRPIPKFSLSPRPVNQVNENHPANYDEELDKLAEYLKTEANEIPVRNQSRLNSPEKKSARPQLQRTGHVRQLSAAYRAPRENVTPPATLQSDPSDAGSGSEN